jgi:hypothetical protein
MMNVIEKLVMDAFGGDTYGKAMICLKVLRDTCKMNEEEEKFNNWLKLLKEKISDEDALGMLAISVCQHTGELTKDWQSRMMCEAMTFSPPYQCLVCDQYCFRWSGHGFWKMVVAEKVTLIASVTGPDGEVEANFSGVSAEEAQAVCPSP